MLANPIVDIWTSDLSSLLFLALFAAPLFGIAWAVETLVEKWRNR